MQAKCDIDVFRSANCVYSVHNHEMAGKKYESSTGVEVPYEQIPLRSLTIPSTHRSVAS